MTSSVFGVRRNRPRRHASGRSLRRSAALAAAVTVGAVLHTVAWQASPAAADPPVLPTEVSLAASPTVLATGQTSTLTATANASVTSTGYAIQIYEQSTGTRYASCVSGTTCSATLNWNDVARPNYLAYVGTQTSTAPPSTVLATSNVVTVSRAPWALTLAGDRDELLNGQTATLTATTNQSVGGTGWAIQVFEQSTGTRYANCIAGTTCTATISWNDAARPHYVAYVGPQTSSPPPSPAVATSNVVTVAQAAWSVTLSSDTYALRNGETATLTATANQSLTNSGFALQVFDVTTGLRLANCVTTTTCATSGTPSWTPTPHTYVAYVGAQSNTAPPASLRATSNAVEIAPAPFSIVLTSSLGWINAGDTVTLTAAANQSVSTTQFLIQVYDFTAHTRVASCMLGATCAVTFTASWPAHAYGAYVADSSGTPPPPNVQARSNAILVPSTYDVPANLGIPANTPSAGDPVNVATGNFFESTGDIAFPATAAGLGYVRTYNSRSSRDGVLGRGWSGSYTASVSVDPLGNAVVVTDEGRAVTFAPDGAGGFVAPAGFAPALAHLGDGTWRLTDPRGGDVRFDAAGALTRTTAGDGSHVDIAYTGGRPATVTSSATGAALTMAYDLDGRLAGVTATDGRAVHFAYAAGLLATATAVDGGVTHYTYDADGRLRTIVDGDGRTKTVNTYDVVGRVTSQVTAHGQRLDLAYSDDATRTTTVTEATTGAVTTYAFDAQARLLHVTDPTGHTMTRAYGATGYLASATDRRSTTAGYTVDANGNVTGRTLPSGGEGYAYDAANRLVAATDAAGHTTTFAYTGTGRVPTLVTWPDLTTTTQTVVAGLVTSTADADGVTRTYGYDATRNLLSVADGLGHQTAMTYDAAGRMLTRTTPLGETTTWTYDAAGRVTSVTDPTGAGTTTTYDHAGHVTSSTDAGQHTTSYAYDNAGQLVRTDFPDGTATTETYDDHGDLLTETEPGGATTTYTYGPLGRLATVTDPMGVTTSYGYDANGAVTTTTDEAGGVTTTAYDASGRVSSVTDALNRVTSYTRDALGRVTATTDPTGAVTTTTYDARGRVASVTDPLTRTTSYAYTPGGRLDHVTYPGGWVQRYAYDAAGRRVSDTNPEVYTTTYTYDDDGRLATRTTPQHLTTAYTYDGAGRVSTVSEPGHGTTVTTYTPTGQVSTRTDATNGVVHLGYNVRDRLASATDANAHVTTYGYDARGNRTTVVDARGHTWSSAYDLADRVTSTTDPLGHASTYTYDALGRVGTIADASGRGRTMTYDAAGQVTRTTFGDGTHVDLTYDGAGRVLTATDASGTETTTYDAAGHLLSDALGGRTVGYAYDLRGRVGEVTYPDGARTTYAYDGNSRPISVAHSDGSAATYTYDGDGRVFTEALPGGVSRSYGYAAGLLASYTETRSGLATTTAVSHDAAGRISGLVTGGSATSYAYDAAGQLTGVDAPGTASDVTYGYDDVGDITSVVSGGSTTARTYDDADRLVSAVSGGVTTSYTYDAAGRLLRAAGAAATTSETYDARGQHVATTRALAGGASTTWTRSYGPAGRLSRVATAQTLVPVLGPPTVTTTSTDVTWDTARGIPQVLALTTGGVASDITYGVGKAFARTASLPAAVFSHDALDNLLPTAGTAGLVVPATGYGAYGRPTTSPVAVAFGYRGELHVGPEIHLRARTYDPAVGRFTSRDPLDGMPGEPVSTNPYHYAGNDPIDAADPTGLDPAITDASLAGSAPTAMGAVAVITEQLCEDLIVQPEIGTHSLAEDVSDQALECTPTVLQTAAAAAAAAAAAGTVTYVVLDGLAGSPSDSKATPAPTPKPTPTPDPSATAPTVRPDTKDNNPPRVLYHYTDGQSVAGIVSTGIMLPSRPEYSRLGQGQYFTDLSPDIAASGTASDLSWALFRSKKALHKTRYYVAVDVQDIPVEDQATVYSTPSYGQRYRIYLHRSTTPLAVADRIRSAGPVGYA